MEDADLRKRAEKIARNLLINSGDYSTVNIKTLIEELHIRQIELEMQNEELRIKEEELRIREAELENSQNKYIELYDFAPVGYCTLDKHGTIMEINLTGAKQLGKERGVILNTRLYEYIIEEDRDIFYLQLRNTFNIRTQQTCRIRIIGKEDESFYAQLVNIANPKNRAESELCRVTFSDITELKKAEFALHKLTAELEQQITERTAELYDLYNNAPCGYHSLDSNGIIVHINDTELKWLGYNRDEVIGKKTFSDFFTEKGVEIFRQNFPLFKAQGSINNLEFDIVGKDGAILSVILNASAIYDSEGKFLRSRTTVFDITERKQIEKCLKAKSEELVIANAALEKASHLKDEFLAGMSHELRTPLSTVLNISESLLDKIYGPLNDQQIKALSTIEKNGQHLLNLINDILDLSKIEAGFMELEIEKCSIDDICQSVLQLIKGMANKKFQNISFAINSMTKCLKVDKRRIKQILVNLLSNAIKFTPENGHIGLEVNGDAAEHIIRFTVWDTGIGIPAEDFDKLFKPFVQLDSSLARRYSGTGLGLSLIKRMTELHGGSVTVESKPGKGSRFTVSLPWRSDDEPSISEQTPVCADSVRHPSTAPSSSLILIVEDNEANIETYSDFLHAKGYQVVVAQNGAEGIQKAQELKPTAILMNIQMPDIDGLEAMRRIRANENPEVASIPVIALTALAMSGDQERCISAGANRYLSKPVCLRMLVKTIEELRVER